MIKVKKQYTVSELGKRNNNEDNFGYVHGTTFVVCDGVGGSNMGEGASELTVKTFIDAFNKNPNADASDVLKLAEFNISDHIVKHPNLEGMATTLTFSQIKDNGVYLCEDVHTSYWLSYGGGHKRKGTFVEFAKNLIDKLNAFHSEENNLQVDRFTKTARSIHYYDSIVVIEKGIITKPTSKMTGAYSFENKNKITLIEKLMLQIIIHLNKLLRIFKLPGIYINKMIEILSKKVG